MESVTVLTHVLGLSANNRWFSGGRQDSDPTAAEISRCRARLDSWVEGHSSDARSLAGESIWLYLSPLLKASGLLDGLAVVDHSYVSALGDERVHEVAERTLQSRALQQAGLGKSYKEGRLKAVYQTIARSLWPILDDHQPGEHSARSSPLRLVTPKVEVHDRVPPSLLVHPWYTPVPLIGRLDELQELKRWAVNPNVQPVSARVLGGQGGSGKTRLALELCSTLSTDEGWTAGFLEEAYSLDQLARFVADPTRRLAVIDYAETRSAQVEEIIASARSSGNTYPLRILLLVRRRHLKRSGMPDLGYATGPETLMVLHTAPPPMALDDRPLDESERRLLFSTAVDTFGGGALDSDVSASVGSFFTLPLALLMGAFLHSHGDVEKKSSTHELLESMLEHERRYWRDFDNSTSMPRSSVDLELGERTIAANALCPTPGRRQTIEMLIQLVADVDRPLAARCAAWAHKRYPSSDPQRSWIAPLEPDLLAEHLVATRLPDYSAWTNALRQDDAVVARALEVLYRMVADRPTLARQLSTVVADELPQLNSRVVRITKANRASPSLARSDHLVSVFTEVLKLVSLDSADLDQALNQLPEQSALLAPLSLRYRTMAIQNLRKSEPGANTVQPDSREELAQKLSDLSSSLGTLGYFEEAHAAALEAVEIYEALEASESARLRSGLATSLGNLSVCLVNLGDHAGALAVSERAVKHYRSLAGATPEVFRGGLGHALHNNAVILGNLGRNEEALEPNEEAIEIFSELVQSDPEQYLPQLARSFDSLAVRLQNLQTVGEPMDGAETATRHANERSVDLYRQLAEETPDSYEQDLARTLTHLSAIAGSQGDHKTALETSGEAVDIYRRLSSHDPETYEHGLAFALDAYSVCLGWLQRTDEALDASEQAVSIYRRLAGRQASFLSYQARSTLNLSAHLARVGRLDTALPLAKEALRIYVDLNDATPGAYDSAVDLARSNLAEMAGLVNND